MSTNKTLNFYLEKVGLPRETNAKRHTLANALRAAAEVFEADSLSQTGNPRLVEQFSIQAKEARDLATEIEEVDIIRLAD
jgi:hypothetical protein